MRKCDALVQAGAAEPLTFNQAGEYFLVRNLGARSDEQLAENLEAVLFAPCVGVAQGTIRFDDVAKLHFNYCVMGPHERDAVRAGFRISD